MRVYVEKRELVHYLKKTSTNLPSFFSFYIYLIMYSQPCEFINSDSQ